MKKVTVSSGVYWIEIPEVDLRILCGCPADVIKHLMHKGLIVSGEKNGIKCENGPNAILLSESCLQNGHFANLAEFPVLQMLYRQGFILPNHPNNTGKKPLLIGQKEAIDAQMAYIHRGNYGLTSMDEMLRSGETKELCQEVMRFKKKFAFDNIQTSEDLIDAKVIEDEPVEILSGVTIQRDHLNVYTIKHGDESTTVDLNLEIGSEYEPPYHLDNYRVEREYFSVIHSGEGDGWDKSRPCMGSILCFQGKFYLVDAGPNLLHTLRALGIGTTEIEGVFHTHAHDDHFNGLTALMNSDHKIKYYAAPLVRQSTIKKFSALLSSDDSEFHNYFEVQDLKVDQWNDIEGLEVRPVISPHPVETTILFFRTLWEDSYKTYAHLADLASFQVLKEMIEDNPSKSGLSQKAFDKVREEYLTPVDVKKIDIGGGLIHGCATDFRTDKSTKILLSHWSDPLDDAEREIGSDASFGTSDVLIPSTQDYTKAKAFHYFQEYFPEAPSSDIRMLLNCQTLSLNPGTILLKKGERAENVYFILKGIMEFVSQEYHVRNKLSSGSMAGELSVVRSEKLRGTFRTISHVNVLEIPKHLYLHFLEKNKIFESAQKNLEKRLFLQMTWLVGEKVSCPLKNRIARKIKRIEVKKGWQRPQDDTNTLYLLEKGEVHLSIAGNTVSIMKHGNFFGEENFIKTQRRSLNAEAVEDSVLWQVPASAIEGIPIIHWKMINAHEKRIKRYREMQKRQLG